MMERLNGWKSQRGFTLMEAIVVMAITMVGAAVAIPVTLQMVQSAKGDSALIMTRTFLESARNRAVAERRNIELVFIAPNRMELVRIEQPSLARTTVATLMLEGNEEYLRLSGLPDTTDNTGGGPSGTVPQLFTGTMPVMFTSDGSLVDAAGDVSNGTIFIARPGKRDTARAISIMGVTGLIRSWKWGGAAWRE